MTAKLSQISRGTIESVNVVHREHLITFDGYQRCARIVVWVTTSGGQRVWVRTVEGGLDSLNIKIKVAMAQEFFQKLVGCEIRFHEGKEGEDTLFAEEESLPGEFLISYQAIRKAMWGWVEANCVEEFEKLRKEKSAKAAATRRANAEDRKAGEARWAQWRAERAERELQQKKDLEERRKNAPHLAFRQRI